MEKIEQLALKDLKNAFIDTIETQFLGVELSKYEKNVLWIHFINRLKNYCSIVETV